VSEANHELSLWLDEIGGLARSLRQELSFFAGHTPCEGMTSACRVEGTIGEQIGARSANGQG
jgi:hypothetical protein